MDRWIAAAPTEHVELTEEELFGDVALAAGHDVRGGFSNRSQKGQLNVSPGTAGLSTGAQVAIAFG